MVICKSKEDCLTVWDVLARWKHVSFVELQDLINGRTHPAYEVVRPHDGSQDVRTLSLRPFDGCLSFKDEDEYIITLHDERGKTLAANVDGYALNEFGEPLVGDSIYFLVEDVARVEESRYLSEPLKGTPLKAVGKLLRVTDAAKLCGISEAEYWRWIGEGKVPRGIKVKGKITLWPVNELQEAMARLVEECRAGRTGKKR